MKRKKKEKKWVGLLEKPEKFKDEFHKWNWILANEGLDVPQPEKLTIKEEILRKRSNKSGIPNWARGKH